jgi:hypothetical protein
MLGHLPHAPRDQEDARQLRAVADALLQGSWPGATPGAEPSP